MTDRSELERYLDRLSGELRGPRRYRRDLIAEIRSHLAEWADAEESRGLDMADIVRRFGNVGAVSGELNQTRCAKTRGLRRRVALASLAVVSSAVALSGVTSRSSKPVRTADGKPTASPIVVTLDPYTGVVLSRHHLPLPRRTLLR